MGRTLAMGVLLACGMCAIGGVAVYEARSADPGSGGEAPSAQFLGAALADQEARGNGTIELRFELKSGVTSATCHYIRTPGMIWVKREEGDGTKDGRIDTVISYDRATEEHRELSTQTRGDKRESGGATRHGLVVGFAWNQGIPDMPLYPWSSPAEIQTLVGAISEGRVAERSETVEAHECWRVDTKPVQDLVKASVWLDREVGFCPRLAVVEQRNGYRSVIEFSSYVDLGEGVVIPGRMVRRLIDVRNGDRTLATNETVVAEAKSGGSFGAEELKVQFPPGLLVHTLDTGVEGEGAAEAPR